MPRVRRECGPNSARPEAGTKTVATALRLLTLFTHTSPEWTVKELSCQLHLPYSTAYRYVSALESSGFLTRDGANGVYRIGLPVIELGGVALHQLDVRLHGMSYLEHLADATGYNANLAVLYQADALHVGFAIRSQVTQYYGVLGRRSPANCTALGKAMLADLPFDQVRRLIEKYGWRPQTPHSIRSFEELERDLAKTRERGYAIDNFERSMESKCIAAAIRNRLGRAAGAISVTIPKNRLSEIDMANLARIVVDHAHMISHHLGYNYLLSAQ